MRNIVSVLPARVTRGELEGALEHAGRPWASALSRRIDALFVIEEAEG